VFYILVDQNYSHILLQRLIFVIIFDDFNSQKLSFVLTDICRFSWLIIYKIEVENNADMQLSPASTLSFELL